MLLECSKKDFEEYMDFVFELALDLSKSGYPTYRDGIKTKAMFAERLLKAFDRDDEQMLRQLVKDKGLEEYIIFEGVKPQDYLKGHLKDFDLLVQPSLYEGFGLTVAEALAAKVPVLVSDIEGPMEIIEDGKYGMAFHCNDADDLASSIRHILLHGYPQSMVEEARDMVCEKYDIAHTAEKYLQAYQEILSN